MQEEPYLKGRIGTVSKAHFKVVHGPQDSFTDKDYFQEDRWIKKLGNAAINLVCSDCFPLAEVRPQYPSRSAEKYDIRYPVIKAIIRQ